MVGVLQMADQDSAKLPEIKPGMFIWGGRFKNRAYRITRIFTDDKGKLKYEMVAVPQGRKHPKVRNVLPFAIMDAEDSAKHKKLYDDEQREKATSKKAAEKVAARFLESGVEGTSVMPKASSEGRLMWECESGKYRVKEASGAYQIQLKMGRSWYDADVYSTLKDALRELRGGL